MRHIKSLLFTLSFLIAANLYTQETVWKYELSNASTGTPANTGKSISVFGGTGAIGNASEEYLSTMYLHVWANNWIGGSGTKGFKITANTTLFENLKISYVQMSDYYTSGSDEYIGPRNFKLD